MRKTDFFCIKLAPKNLGKSFLHNNYHSIVQQFFGRAISKVSPVLVLLVLLALLVLLVLLMTKHRQLRCLPFPEEAVSLSRLSVSPVFVSIVDGCRFAAKTRRASSAYQASQKSYNL